MSTANITSGTMLTSIRKATQTHPALRAPNALDNIAVQVRGLNHFYGKGELRKQVLYDNNLDLTRGELVIMTGPSGSGKTTLLTLIGALRTVQEGSLKVMGKEMAELDRAELGIVRRDIGFIFQAHNLFESLTALQNVRMALELKETDSALMNDRATEMLKALGLGHRIHYKPDSLSGGQRQRVAISRALVNRPKLILADEPTAALDKQSSRDVVDLLRTFAKEERCTILMVTHDNRILDVADRIVNMVDGRVISDVLIGESTAICEFLKRCTLFASFTPSQLAKVADRMDLEEFEDGSLIIKQGDPGEKFYVLRSGNAQVWIETRGERRKVATLKEGDFFGEAALLSGDPRNATVQAQGTVELYALGKEDFQQVIETTPSFGDELRKVLFERQ